jgi:hypothetical protein
MLKVNEIFVLFNGMFCQLDDFNSLLRREHTCQNPTVVLMVSVPLFAEEGSHSGGSSSGVAHPFVAAGIPRSAAGPPSGLRSPGPADVHFQQHLRTALADARVRGVAQDSCSGPNEEDTCQCTCGSGRAKEKGREER